MKIILLFSNELGVNNTGTPVAVKHENIKYVGKNYHPDLVHPESISFDSTFTDSIISGKTYSHVLLIYYFLINKIILLT